MTARSQELTLNHVWQEPAQADGIGNIQREASLIGVHPPSLDQEGSAAAKPEAVQDLGVVGRGKRRITLQPKRIVPGESA